MFDRSQGLIIFAFLLANFLGIVAAMQLISTGNVQETPLASEEPKSSLNLFLGILAVTAVMLILYKINARFLIKLWYFLAIFITNVFFFSTFGNLSVSILSSVILLALFIGLKNWAIQNIVKIFSFSGAGAFLGSAFGFLPSLILLALISAYDAIAVNFTKHMTSLAKKTLKEDVFMGLVFPRNGFGKKGELDLRNMKESEGLGGKNIGIKAIGGGDIVIPMIFSIAVMKEFGIIASILALFGASTALIILMKKSRGSKFYPGMPFLSIGLSSGFLLFFFLKSFFSLI